MRYIGNKTKLLPFLRSAIARLGITPGVAHDACAGTAAVARALKSDGWIVHSSDLMTYSYVMQRAYVVASRIDTFDELARADPGVRALIDRGRGARRCFGFHRCRCQAIERSRRSPRDGRGAERRVFCEELQSGGR